MITATLCAWCGEPITPAVLPQDDSLAVSHGICLACADDIYRETGIALGDFLELMELPVVLIDGNGIVREANRAARALVGKEPSEIAGHPGGEVFDCAYSLLPEGCGRTVHCSGCAIRRSVLHTHATGTPLSAVPATIRKETPDRFPDIDLFLSTRKTGDYVLLAIEQTGSAAG